MEKKAMEKKAVANLERSHCESWEPTIPRDEFFGKGEHFMFVGE
jgi:hypothetical protein